jgi:hypothetical protein
MCLNIFCGGLLILILLILWLMFRRMVRPVLSFIFHPVKGNETYVVPRTGFMGVVVLLASIVGFTFLWFSVSTILGVGAELFNPIYFFLLVLAIVVAAGAILGLEYSYRSMYDVLRLERHGVAENPVLGELFHVMGIDDDGTVVSSPFVQYSYAKDFKGNLRLYPEFGEEEAYKKGRLQITVTYLPEMPGLHRVSKKKTAHQTGSETFPASELSRPVPSETGPAEEVIPRALTKFTRAESGTFIIFWHRETKTFVQFLKLGDAMLLYYSMSSAQATDALTLRSHEYFARHEIQMETEPRGAGSYQMDFPPGPDQVKQAAGIAFEIFDQVFLLPRTSILEVEVGK